MIGVSVSVDDQIQTPSVIREDREVALDLVAHRIDDGGLARCFCDRKVGFALAAIQFAKDHLIFPRTATGAWPLPNRLDRNSRPHPVVSTRLRCEVESTISTQSATASPRSPSAGAAKTRALRNSMASKGS